MRRNRLFTAGVAAVALGLTVLVGPTLSAQAATPVAVSSAAAQSAAASSVAGFVTANPVPVLVTGATAAQYTSFSASLASYWKSVPWSSVYAQWGCTVSDVQIDYHATDGSWGTAGASMSAVASCPIGVPIADLQTVAPKSSIQAAEARKATREDVASPNSAQTQGCTGGQGSNLICVNSPSTGVLNGGNDNLTSNTETGHVRLGLVGAGNACGLGTFIANGPTQTIGYSQVVSATHSISQSSQYGARFYDPNYVTQACNTF